MHHALAENGIGCCNLVHMGVEVVTAEAGKVNDIRFGQCTTWRQQAVARLDLFEVFTKRVNTIFLYPSATHPLLAYRREHGWAALNGGALHVVFHRTQTAQLFTAACASRPAVDQQWQRRAVTGRFRRGLFVQHLNTPVGAGRTEDKLSRQFAARRHQRSCQTAFTGARQRHGMLGILIRHQRGDRTKGFNCMYRGNFIRLRTKQQRWREESPSRAQICFSAQQHLTPGFNQTIHIILHVLTLIVIHQRPHLHAFLRRIAHYHFLQTGNQRLADCFHLRLWHDNAADSGTFLPGFGRHLAHDFTYKQCKLRLFWGDVITQHAAVE